jgi:hypothetical protein
MHVYQYRWVIPVAYLCSATMTNRIVSSLTTSLQNTALNLKPKVVPLMSGNSVPRALTTIGLTAW